MRRAEKRVSNVVEERRTEEDEERMDDRGRYRREDKGEEGSLGLNKKGTYVSILAFQSNAASNMAQIQAITVINWELHTTTEFVPACSGFFFSPGRVFLAAFAC